MLNAEKAFQQTQQNEMVMKKRELGDVEKTINNRIQNGDYYCYEQIRFPETINKLRENGYIVNRDSSELSSELGYKIFWGNPDQSETEEEQ